MTDKAKTKMNIMNTINIIDTNVVSGDISLLLSPSLLLLYDNVNYIAMKDSRIISKPNSRLHEYAMYDKVPWKVYCYVG